jgi:hypothetical protein
LRVNKEADHNDMISFCGVFMNKLLLTATAVLVVTSQAFAELPKLALAYDGGQSAGKTSVGLMDLQKFEEESTGRSGESAIHDAIADDLWGDFREIKDREEAKGNKVDLVAKIGADGRVESSGIRVDRGPGNWLQINIKRNNGFQEADRLLPGIRDLGRDTVGSNRLSSLPVVEPVVVAAAVEKRTDTRLADAITSDLSAIPGAERHADEIREMARDMQIGLDGMGTSLGKTASQVVSGQEEAVDVNALTADRANVDRGVRAVSNMILTEPLDELVTKHGSAVGLALYAVQEKMKTGSDEALVSRIVPDEKLESFREVITGAQMLVDAAGGLGALADYVTGSAVEAFKESVIQGSSQPKLSDGPMYSREQNESVYNSPYGSVKRARVVEEYSVDTPDSPAAADTSKIADAAEKVYQPLLQANPSAQFDVAPVMVGDFPTSSWTTQPATMRTVELSGTGAGIQNKSRVSILEIVGQRDGIQEDLVEEENNSNDTNDENSKKSDVLEEIVSGATASNS